MKKGQQHTYNCYTSFMSIPIVRLDSKAIRIPVEFTDKLIPEHRPHKTLRIAVLKDGFWVWR